MTDGILYFAENNEKLDYIQMACFASKLAKEHMPGINTALVTSDDIDKNFVSKYFDDIIITEKSKKQLRVFKGNQKRQKLSYFNSNRIKSYQLTPFNKTIVVDVDFLILNNNLSSVFNSQEHFLINKDAKNLSLEPLHINDMRINDRGLKTRWATLIYFDKSKFSETVFKLVNHIADNYFFYSRVYGYNSNIFRNDYVFSIACHILSNFSDVGIGSLPEEFILTSEPDDKILSFNENKLKIMSKNMLLCIEDNVHIMNKFDLNEIVRFI